MILIGYLNEDVKFMYGALIATENIKLEENYYYTNAENLIWITAIFDNGQPNIAYAFQFGTKMKLPVVLVKEGYKFNGWINTANGNPVTENNLRTINI